MLLTIQEIPPGSGPFLQDLPLVMLLICDHHHHGWVPGTNQAFYSETKDSGACTRENKMLNWCSETLPFQEGQEGPRTLVSLEPTCVQ
jgi:hypothetical protein